MVLEQGFGNLWLRLRQALRLVKLAAIASQMPQLCCETDFSLGKGMSECKRFFANSRKLLE